MNIDLKYYPYDEWTYVENHNQFDYDTNLYVDLEGNPITGILQDFKFYTKNDSRNDWFVVEGNRLCSVIELKEFIDCSVKRFSKGT